MPSLVSISTMLTLVGAALNKNRRHKFLISVATVPGIEVVHQVAGRVKVFSKPVRHPLPGVIHARQVRLDHGDLVDA